MQFKLATMSHLMLKLSSINHAHSIQVTLFFCF
uniref:Uncharacterized protein n=1 Tax=Parascaris equorum TaxID=6256 RepID=A0A914RKJ1_PAREQ